MNRASKLSRFMLTPSHAQPGSVMLTVVPRTTKTPRCSRNLLRSQVPRQRPLWCGFATSTLRSCCPPPPSPAAPTQATPAKLSCPVLNPRRSRAFHAAHAPRQRLTQACAPGHPDKSGFHGVEHPASQAGKLDLFLSSTASPQPLSAASTHTESGPPDRPIVWPAATSMPPPAASYPRAQYPLVLYESVCNTADRFAKDYLGNWRQNETRTVVLVGGNCGAPWCQSGHSASLDSAA